LGIGSISQEAGKRNELRQVAGVTHFEACPIASGVSVPVGAVDIAIDQDDTAVVNVEYSIFPFLGNLAAVFGEAVHRSAYVIACGGVNPAIVVEWCNRVIGPSYTGLNLVLPEEFAGLGIEADN